MTKIAALLLLTPFAVMGCVADLDADTPKQASEVWQPDRNFIVGIEKKLEPMPRGASPLGQYVRFYSGVNRDGQRILFGMFVRPALLTNKETGLADEVGVAIVHIDEMPQIMDARCSVVILKIDVDLRKVLVWRCDGGA